MATLILMSARPCTAVGEMVKYSELFPVKNTWNMLFTPCRRKDKREAHIEKHREQGMLRENKVGKTAVINVDNNTMVLYIYFHDVDYETKLKIHNRGSETETKKILSIQKSILHQDIRKITTKFTFNL